MYVKRVQAQNALMLGWLLKSLSGHNSHPNGPTPTSTTRPPPPKSLISALLNLGQHSRALLLFEEY